MFLTRIAAEKRKKFRGISEEAARIMLNHTWPGNVRELKNAIEWVVFMWDDNLIRPVLLE
jgi:DNA-binding NtrC family response regulator